MNDPLGKDETQKNISTKRRLHLSILLILLGFAAFYFWPRTHSEGFKPSLSENLQYQEGLMTIPETERPLDFAVIGVDSDRPDYFMLPDMKPSNTFPSPQYEEVREQLYWLNYELCHGRVLNALPPLTKLYVALPDPKRVKEATGREEKYFLDYLRTRCLWPEERIRNQVRFFKSPVPLIWAQDIGKILGRDDRGRWVIFRGAQDIPLYRQAVLDLCAAYPDQFSYRDLPNGVSAEGGDEDLVRTPEGNQLLILGRHRALRLMNTNSTPSQAPSLNSKDVQQDQRIFSQAFAGLPVCLMPAGALVKPSLGNDELFHLDMSTAIVGTAREARAFVPTYLPNPIDRITGQPLDLDFVKTAQWEFDQIADELEGLGYRVERLPFGDHPVRSPANLIRYYDPEKGKCVVLLAKYPVHDVEGKVGAITPQEELKAKLDSLQRASDQWQNKPEEAQFRFLIDALAKVWADMDDTDKEVNPIFDQWVKIFNREGIEVIPVSDFAWGAGGLHCQMLR